MMTIRGLWRTVCHPFRIYVQAPLLRYRQRRYVEKLKREEQINVVFFAMSLSMWKYQALYERMKGHPRFRPFVVLSPTPQFAKEIQKAEVETMRRYFDERGISYIDYDVDSGRCVNLRKEISPDILFYPQPYDTVLKRKYSFYHFKDKLICYYPYAFWMASGKEWFDSVFHHFAWKLYYPTSGHKTEAAKWMHNGASNVVITGHPTTDHYLFELPIDVWKPQEQRKKRIVWAPHHTIRRDTTPQGTSHFLQMAEFMEDIAVRYAADLQIAFKPHPRLFTALCEHPDWGKERAEAYYHRWAERSNTQLEDGDYKDLFMTSDAIIHDGGSFIVEYHYSQKPALYVTDNLEGRLEELMDYAKEALHAHYLAKDNSEVLHFIESVVIAGDDTMQADRKAFFDTYLLPPNGKSVAENTLDDLINAFSKD